MYVIFHNVNGARKSRTIRKNVVDEYVQDLFFVERVLSPKTDTLIVVIDDEPNDTIREHVKSLFDKEGIFVVVHNIQRLQFNIKRHVLVPQHRVLDEAETEAVLRRYNVADARRQIPEISRFDPVAMALCMRPNQLCHIVRKSPTALVYDYYRICI